MLEIPWNGVKMLLEIPLEGSKKNEVPQQGGGADINWNSPLCNIIEDDFPTTVTTKLKPDLRKSR